MVVHIRKDHDAPNLNYSTETSEPDSSILLPILYTILDSLEASTNLDIFQKPTKWSPAA
jgi:hypothetical protein